MKVHFGTDFNKDKLKNHFKIFKNWYSAIKVLHNMSGFGWDGDEKRSLMISEYGITANLIVIFRLFPLISEYTQIKGSTYYKCTQQNIYLRQSMLSH